MPDDIVTWDQSSYMAHRALDAAEIGPPENPPQVALPGAKAAIDHDRLLAHQELGHGAEEIVERVNARWEDENRERLDAHRAWVRGPYLNAIERMHQAEMQRKAEEQRRQALFEEMVREREQAREGS